jgi:hypothetical protein
MGACTRPVDEMLTDGLSLHVSAFVIEKLKPICSQALT